MVNHEMYWFRQQQVVCVTLGHTATLASQLDTFSLNILNKWSRSNICYHSAADKSCQTLSEQGIRGMYPCSFLLGLCLSCAVCSALPVWILSASFSFFHPDCCHLFSLTCSPPPPPPPTPNKGCAVAPLLRLCLQRYATFWRFCFLFLTLLLS